jgi:hypothetical protein
VTIARFMVGSNYCAEALALFARMSTQPNLTRKRLIDSTIRSLKNAGLWDTSLIPALYFLAAHDAQAARLNWIQNASNLSANAGMTFTTDRGYTGDASSGALTASYTAPSGSHTHIGIWANSFGSAGATVGTGGTNGWTVVTNADISGRWANINTVGATAAGHYGVMSTADATTLRFYKNGSQVGTTGIAFNNLSFGTLSIGVSGGVLSDSRHAIVHAGDDLTSGQIASLYAIFNGYLTRLGAT